MAISNDEKYVNKRDSMNNAMDQLFKLGEECGFTKDQVADDILDYLSDNYGISCTQD